MSRGHRSSSLLPGKLNVEFRRFTSLSISQKRSPSRRRRRRRRRRESSSSSSLLNLRINPVCKSADKSGNLVGRGGEGREKWPTNRSWLEKRIIIRAGGRALYLHIGGADNDGAGFKLKCCLPRYLNTAAALCLSRVASSRVESRGESFPLGRRHSMDFEGKGLKGDVDDFRRWSKCWGIRG